MRGPSAAKEYAYSRTAVKNKMVFFMSNFVLAQDGIVLVIRLNAFVLNPLPISICLGIDELTIVVESG